MDSTNAAAPIVAAEDIVKSYAGAAALRGVSLSLWAGEVHGLVGANGAGKSTLIRVLAGLTQPDSGRILLDGVPIAIATPHRANELGMSFIHQELAFVPSMTVIQNILLGLPKRARWGMLDWGAMAREVGPLAKRVGITAPLGASVKNLSTADRWLINICRALLRQARLIVMDEPTASLSALEAATLFTIIEDLSRSGIAILYVSHRLDEVLRLCHHVTAFRDGRVVASLPRAAMSRAALVDAIVGDQVATPASTFDPARAAEVVLNVNRLSRLPRVQDVSLALRRGEVLGIGGLVGAGRTELARLIYGADRAESGTMTLNGVPFRPRNPPAAVRAGLGLVPEERRSDGLVLTKSVAFNLQLANLRRIRRGPFIDPRRRRSLSLDAVRDLSIKTPSLDVAVGRLSGGNQQKVVIGRWLLRAPRVLMLDEPTRGVDVGARAEIHRLVRSLAAQGMAVLVISSEPDELPDVCDRVVVMSEGRIVRELSGEALTRGNIIAASYATADGDPGR